MQQPATAHNRLRWLVVFGTTFTLFATAVGSAAASRLLGRLAR